MTMAMRQTSVPANSRRTASDPAHFAIGPAMRPASPASWPKWRWRTKSATPSSRPNGGARRWQSGGGLSGGLGKLLRRAPQMTSSPLSRLRYRNNGDAMREVASELRRIAEEFPAHGDERMSLGLLARMIDPAAPGLLGWPKLVIKHAGKGTPKARDDRLGFFMWAHRDVLKKKSEHVLALAKEKYGACKSRAHKALASEREHAARLPDVYARHADEIRFINSLGRHGGFQPAQVRVIPGFCGLLYCSAAGFCAYSGYPLQPFVGWIP